MNLFPFLSRCVSPFGTYAVISLSAARAQSKSPTGLILDLVSDDIRPGHGTLLRRAHHGCHDFDLKYVLIISRPVKQALANRKT